MFRATEPMFHPSLVGNENNGIHQLAETSILKSPFFIQNQMRENIVLHGNSTLFEGFDKRLQKEMMKLTSNEKKFHVEFPTRFSAFYGSKILAPILDESKGWFTKEEYEEFGCSRMIHGSVHPTLKREFPYDDEIKFCEADCWISSSDPLYSFVISYDLLIKTSNAQRKMPRDVHFHFI